MRIFLNVCYDGTNYNGFQIQKNAPTIQEEIETGLKKCFGKEIKIIGASRTDTGVHAMGQKIVFDLEKTTVPVEKIPLVLNSKLPKDIVINYVKEVENTFHPRYDAKEKIYTYVILNAEYPIPMYRDYTYYYNRKLDLNKMISASKYFIGTFDFKGFCSSGSSVKNTVRTIYDLDIKKENDLITIKIRGNGFLYNMIRIIVGTLLEAGSLKIEPEEIKNIILSKDRNRAGKTAPPNGLTLMEIFY